MKNFIPISTRPVAPGTSTGQGLGTREEAIGNSRQHEMVYLATLVLLCFVLFFLFLGNRPLWDVDEGMHAATSKDMILSGDWITPQLNGENFYDKPVLFNWLVAISFLVFGFTEFAARLPAAVLGTGSVLVTYFLGRRMFNPTVGFLGGVILATGVEFIILSRVVVHDIALTFFITLALYLFFHGFSDTSLRKSVWLFFYASLGFAVLAKGPIGVLLPGLIIFLFLVIKRRLNIVGNMQLGWGILIFLAVAAPWYVLIMLKNQDYAGYFFIQQNLAYFFSGESRHPRPFYYYFPILVGGFFPWSLFLPAALFRALRRSFGKKEDATLFLLLWFGAVFLFFSAASSKLSTYILPLFPAVSLLTAALWRDLWVAPSQTGTRRGILYPIGLLLATALSAVVYMLVNPLDKLTPRYGIPPASINILGLTMVVLTGLIFFFLIIRRDKSAFAAITGMVVVGLLLFILLIVPYINPYRSTKGLAEKLDTLLPQGEKMTFVHGFQDTALFYTDRKASILRRPQEITDFLASDERVFCVIKKRYFDVLESYLPTAHVWDQEGDKLLISNTKAL
ncbi:MAG: glycosyltransferase family 39 protein [Desulfobacterales bacterium]